MLALVVLGFAGALSRPGPARLFLEPSAETGQVVKPALDGNTYAYHTLKNGMKVMAVENPTTVKAGFSVSVNAGSFSDPVDFPGLAHFCEHMLFLGNEKYPEQGDFDSFLSQHDGMSNAYTDQEMTVYFNEVGMSGFEGALDRFAQFFISPLFNVSMAKKEINAVDSEHKKNLPDAFRRSWEVMRSLANPESPVSHFYTGDISTLLTDESGEAVVAALKKYHKENYCAQREQLVIVANMSTDKMIEYAEEYFSEVPTDGCVDRVEFNAVEPWEGRLGEMIHMGTKGQAQLWAMFSMPRVWEHYRSQPGSYLSYVFADATSGSLRSALKGQNLATGVSSWVSDTSASAMLWVVIDLTENGEEKYPEVMETLYGYLDTVREHGVDEEVYSSLADLGEVHFEYQDPPDSVMSQVSNLASSLTNYGAEDVLTSSYLITEKNADVMKTYLDRLQPKYSNVALILPSFTTPEEEKARVEKNENGAPATVEFEKFYEVAYLKQPISGKLQELITTPFANGNKPGFKPPYALQHVPKVFEVTTETSGPHPERLEAAKAETWWKGIGVHKLPKAQVAVKLSFGKDVADAELAALGMLHADLVRDALEEEVDELLSTGLNYYFTKEGDGFSLTFTGFDQYMEVLMAKVIHKIRAPNVSSFIFNRNRLAKIDRFKDVTSSQPHEHASEFYSVAMNSDAYSRAEYLHFLEAESTTVERVQEVVQKALAKSRITTLFVGNIPAKRAEKMTEQLETLLEDHLSEEEEFVESVVHPKQEVLLRVKNPIPDDTNHATINVYQWPQPPTVEQRVQLLLLGSMLHGTAFDELRTTRQLGYVVSAGTVPHGPIGELRVLVQGAKATPDQVDDYIEIMLGHFREKLETMDSKEFQLRKEGVRLQLSKDDQTMGAEAARYWHSIRDKSYCFQRRELSVQALDKMNDKTSLLAFWDELIGEKRTKVSVQVFGHGIALKSNVTVPTGAVALYAETDAASLREDKPEYYPNEHLCPDKVLLLEQMQVYMT